MLSTLGSLITLITLNILTTPNTPKTFNYEELYSVFTFHFSVSAGP